jgi:hypothetical protein
MILIIAEVFIFITSAMHAGVSCEGIGCTTICQHSIAFRGLAKQRDLFILNVHESVHRESVTTRCYYVQFTIFLYTALHVSGGNSTHHQEHV